MKIARRVQAIGPRPVLLLRYSAHHAAGRVRTRRLRARYDDIVAAAPAGARLDLPAISIGSADDLPVGLRTDAERIRDEADAALRHEVDLLGSGPVELGAEIDWHTDFKSGYRWDPDFYLDVGVTRLGDGSDAKVPWELSRGHHLLTLARAACLFDDDRCHAELESQLDAWIAANPTGFGINWVNAMEVAIRAVNWIWALALVERRRPLRAETQAAVTRSLQSHGRHIAANLEGSPWLRSNHYLADVLGLLVLGATVRDDPAAPGWLDRGRAAFERQIEAQVHDDGLAFEASLPYHALVLEMFLLARYICAAANRPLSPAYDARVRRMLEATGAVRHPSGRLPQTGDNDSGRILPGGTFRGPNADHLLSLGAAIMNDARPLPGPPHTEVAWTLGPDAWSELDRRPERTPTPRCAFPGGGIYVLARDRLHAVVRCGDVGQNGNGGHAHNDALSFELSCGDEPFVVDSGTYVYTSDAAARNAFRGTTAHSTVVVQGAEIHPIPSDRLFELKQFARIRVHEFEQSETHVRLVASHDGYRRLQPATTHRRTFEVDDSGTLLVEDVLLGTGRQAGCAYVHLAPGARVMSLEPDTYALELGAERLTVRITGADEVVVDEGWVSDRFGVRTAAPVLIARVEGSLPLSLRTRFERRAV